MQINAEYFCFSSLWKPQLQSCFLGSKLLHILSILKVQEYSGMTEGESDHSYKTRPLRYSTENDEIVSWNTTKYNLEATIVFVFVSSLFSYETDDYFNRNRKRKKNPWKFFNSFSFVMPSQINFNCEYSSPSFSQSK